MATTHVLTYNYSGSNNVAWTALPFSLSAGKYALRCVPATDVISWAELSTLTSGTYRMLGIDSSSDVIEWAEVIVT